MASSDDAVAAKLAKGLAAFGKTAFRPGQEQAVRAVLEKRGDVLVSVPTGGGKSLCYMMPAALQPGAPQRVPTRSAPPPRDSPHARASPRANTRRRRAVRGHLAAARADEGPGGRRVVAVFGRSATVGHAAAGAPRRFRAARRPARVADAEVPAGVAGDAGRQRALDQRAAAPGAARLAFAACSRRGALRLQLGCALRPRSCALRRVIVSHAPSGQGSRSAAPTSNFPRSSTPWCRARR